MYTISYLLCMCLRCCVNMIIVDKIWLFLISCSSTESVAKRKWGLMSYRSPVPFLVGDSIQLEADTLPKPDSSIL